MQSLACIHKLTADSEMNDGTVTVIEEIEDVAPGPLHIEALVGIMK